MKNKKIYTVKSISQLYKEYGDKIIKTSNGISYKNFIMTNEMLNYTSVIDSKDEMLSCGGFIYDNWFWMEWMIMPKQNLLLKI